MNINNINTKKLSYDPKDKMFLRDMEKIKRYRFNVKGLSSKKALTYMVLMYDRHSELLQTIPNYARRKRIAAIASGFELGDDGHFSARVKDMLTGKVKEFNQAMVYFCVKQREPLLVRLAVLDHVQVDLAIKALEDYDKGIHELSDSVAKRIVELREELFAGQETEEIIGALYDEIDDRELGLDVENIVEKLNSVGLKEFGEYTYGKDYEEPRVEFAGETVPKKSL